MIHSKICAGICGFKTEVIADSKDQQNVTLVIKSECRDVQKLAEEIKEVDGYAEIFAKIGDGNIYNKAQKFLKHGACPIPMAILKTIECTCKLAIPKDVFVEIVEE